MTDVFSAFWDNPYIPSVISEFHRDTLMQIWIYDLSPYDSHYSSHNFLLTVDMEGKMRGREAKIRNVQGIKDFESH